MIKKSLVDQLIIVCILILLIIITFLGVILPNNLVPIYETNVYNYLKQPLSFLQNEDDINIKIESILEEFQIERLKNKQIYKLSGGEKKVVAIAGIIVMNPEIILMDEVTSYLDPKSRRRVINLIKD